MCIALHVWFTVMQCISNEPELATRSAKPSCSELGHVPRLHAGGRKSGSINLDYVSCYLNQLLLVLDFDGTWQEVYP